MLHNVAFNFYPTMSFFTESIQRGQIPKVQRRPRGSAYLFSNLWIRWFSPGGRCNDPAWAAAEPSERGWKMAKASCAFEERPSWKQRIKSIGFETGDQEGSEWEKQESGLPTNFKIKSSSPICPSSQLLSQPFPNSLAQSPREKEWLSFYLFDWSVFSSWRWYSSPDFKCASDLTLRKKV